MKTIEELADWVAHRGGVAHTMDIRRAGFTTHGIRSSLARGLLVPVRRSWVATAQCDPQVRRAVAASGRLTCLTQAVRLGLWTPSHDEIHVAVPPTASRIDAVGLRLHWSTGPSPTAPHAVTDPVANVLFHVARCVPMADALAVWESALRTKRTDAAVLARIRWHSEVASKMAAAASVLSDSGIETVFVQLMRDLGVPLRQQVWIDGHPVDGLIGERLVVQIDGFAHHQARDRRRDLRADARLVLRGYTVLRFDYQQVLFQQQEVLDTVATAVAQGLDM